MPTLHPGKDRDSFWIPGNFADLLVNRLEATVHFAVNLVVKAVIQLHVRGFGLEGFAGAGHGFAGLVVVGVDAETYRGIHRGAEAGGLVGVGAFGGEIENIGGQLHCGIGLRAATRNDQSFDFGFLALFEPFFAFSKGIGQPFKGVPVQKRQLDSKLPFGAFSG